MCKKAVWMQLPLLASSYVPESTASSLATYMYILMICLCECDAVDSGGRTQTTDSTWAKQSGGRKMSPASCRLDQSAACCKFDDVVIDVTLSCVYTIGHMLPLAWKHVSRQLVSRYIYVDGCMSPDKYVNRWVCRLSFSMPQRSNEEYFLLIWLCRAKTIFTNLLSRTKPIRKAAINELSQNRRWCCWLYCLTLETLCRFVLIPIWGC